MSQTRSYRFRWIGLLFVSLSVIVISLDNTALNAALPSIARQLAATTTDLQWIVDGYVLVFAALLLTSGAISDRFGRKRILQIGLVFFAIDSVLTATATSTSLLIIYRAALGLGGSLILPATLSTVTATFPAKERAQAIAIWAAIFGLGVGIGPAISGFLLEHFNWNSIFWVNVPVCALALIGGAVFLGETKDEHPPAFDLPGVILSIAGLFILTYGIIEAGVRGWSDGEVLAALGIGALILAVFGWWEIHTPNAMLPMRFFKNPSFSIASLDLGLVLFTQFGFLFFISPYLQTIQGYSTFQAGLRLLPFALTITGMASMSARITRRLGVKRMVALGVAIAACGAIFMAVVYQPGTSYTLVFAGEVIFGFGIGMTFSPATNSIMQAVPLEKAGIGSAMNDTTRQVSGAFGVAVLGTVLNLSYIGGLGALKTAPQLSGIPAGTLALVAGSVQSAHLVAATLPAPAASLIIATADRAYLSGMDNGLLVGAGMLLIASLLALFFLPSQPRRSEEALSEGLSNISSIEARPLDAAAGDR